MDGDVVDGTSSLMFERVITGAGRRVMPHLFAPLTMGRPGLIDGRDPAEVAHADACDVICQSVAKVSSASSPKSWIDSAHTKASCGRMTREDRGRRVCVADEVDLRRW